MAKTNLKKNWWQEFFDEHYLKLYDFEDVVTKQEVEFIIKELNLKKEDKILDLCCGNGRHSLTLAKKGYSVVGIDYSSFLISEAKRSAKDIGLDNIFIRKDMRKLNFKNVFDAIVNLFTSFGYFEKDEENEEVLKCVYNALKPSGKFLIDTVNSSWLLVNKKKHTFMEIENACVVEKSEFSKGKKQIKTTVTFIIDEEVETRTTSVWLYTYSGMFGRKRKNDVNLFFKGEIIH